MESSRWPLQQSVRILLECILVTACKRSLGQGNIFAPVCHSVQRGVPGPGGCLVWGVPGGDPPDGHYSGRYASYWNTFLFQFFLLKHVASRLLFVVVLPAAIYISTFYVHLTLLTKAGPNDDIMTSAFQASLEVPCNLPCNGLFTLPDSDSNPMARMHYAEVFTLLVVRFRFQS